MSRASEDPSPTHEEAYALIAQVLALLAQVTEKFDAQEGEGWQWLRQHSSDPLIVEMLHDLTPTAMRVVDAIGRLEPVNGITISAHARVPKGTVSKVTRRLAAQKLVSTESLPNNKKEIFFRLTPLGRELFQVHRTFDEQMERGFRRFLQRYDPDELRLLVRVLYEATEASFLTLGLQGPTAQELVEGSTDKQAADSM
jgi:DNA-binding MarR family transcriptional regulator